MFEALRDWARATASTILFLVAAFLVGEAIGYGLAVTAMRLRDCACSCSPAQDQPTRVRTVERI